MLLALVPLAAVSGMLVARLAMGDEVALGVLSRSLPAEARELVSRELGKVASYDGGRLGVLATVVFVWLASSGVHAVFDVLEALAGSTPRAWWRKRLISVGSCLALAVAMGIIALLASPFATALRSGDAAVPGAAPISLALKLAAGVGTDLFLTIGLYHVAFVRTERPSRVLPGAALAVGLQVVLGAAYALSIRVVGDGSAYLAGLAVFAVTMTAVFIYMLSLLLGLSLNLVLHAPRSSTGVLVPTSSGRGS